MDSPTTVATLLALALGLVKVVESLVSWMIKRFMSSEKDSKTTIVELGPDVSKMLRDMSGQVATMHSINSKVDDNGAPLVYGPRYEVHQVAAAIADVEKKVDDVGSDVQDIYRVVDKKKE